MRQEAEAENDQRLADQLSAPDWATRRRHRKGWLQKRYGVDYPDQLDSGERSRVIEMLKEEKEAANG